ncbi:MAG TPA: thiamine-phosphate kinase [Methanocorpusculum sp.]|nr:thiamine-phosphate kinase [Methanocorpusculum sp.]
MNDRELLQKIIPLIGKDETSDDCAAFDLGDGRVLVSSTDMLHRKTDFPTGSTDFENGWQSVAVTLSDIASCGAKPIQVLVAIGLDEPDRFVSFMEGACACAKSFGCAVSGGDIDSHDELTVVTTALGIVEKKYLCRRGGAKAGDLVCITRMPGLAQAALNGDMRYWKNLVQPVPQVFEGCAIARLGATAMMDVSDGLAISLWDLAEASGVKIELDLSGIDLPDVTGNPEEYFFFGGGDYGLLFTLPAGVKPDVSYRVIGRVMEGCGVVYQDRELPARGYEHTW